MFYVKRCFIYSFGKKLYNKTSEVIYINKIDISYLGPVLKSMRKSSGLTLEELSARIDISTRHLIAIENECAGISVDCLILLVRALNIPPHAIIYPDWELSDAPESGIQDRFRRLSDRDRELILSLMNKMLDSAPDT